MDIDHIILKNRINMHHRLEETKNELPEQILNLQSPQSWIKKTEAQEEQMNINYITYLSKSEAKKITMDATAKKFSETIQKTGETKSKVQFLKEGKGTLENTQ